MEKTEKILSAALQVYPDIVKVMPAFNTPMYDALLALAGKMAALKKGMRSTGITTEEFVKFSIDQTRLSASKVPLFLRRLGGKIYLSRLLRKYLKEVATGATKNGWPIHLIHGSKKDDFDMSVEAIDCQIVAFWESI